MLKPCYCDMGSKLSVFFLKDLHILVDIPISNSGCPASGKFQNPLTEVSGPCT